MPRLLPLAAALLAPLCLPAASAAAGPPARAAVVGGAPSSAPWAASVAYVTAQTSATTASACTGTVLAAGVVLTAAHCVTDDAGRPERADGIVVTTGRLAHADVASGRLHLAARLLVHPAYEPRSLRADLALVLLATAAAAPPLALADAGDARPGARLSVAGWGVTSPEQQGRTPRLMAASTTLLDDDACAWRLGAAYLAEAMACAADAPGYRASVCRGDSGGPLVATRPDGTPVQVGVTSWGSLSCSPRSPQAFTRLSAYAGWLAEQLAAAPVPAPPAAPAEAPAAPGATRAVPAPPAAAPPTAALPATAPAGPAARPGAGRGASTRYHGRTRQRRAVAVRLADGRLASLRAGYRARCGDGGRRSGTLRLAGRGARPARAARGRPAFALRRRAGRRLAHVAGTLHGGRVRGTLRVRWRASSGARCDTGVVRYAAR